MKPSNLMVVELGKLQMACYTGSALAIDVDSWDFEVMLLVEFKSAKSESLEESAGRMPVMLEHGGKRGDSALHFVSVLAHIILFRIVGLCTLCPSKSHTLIPSHLMPMEEAMKFDEISNAGTGGMVQ